MPTVSIIPTVVVNGGAPAYFDSLGQSVSLTGQSSVVEQLQVTFNEPVTLDANAFSIINIGQSITVVAGPNPSSYAVTAVQTAVPDSDSTQWIVTFTGAGTNAINGGTGAVIKDGLYLLDIDGSKVHAGDQTAVGHNYTPFWALYGNFSYDTLEDSSIELYLDGYDVVGFDATYGSESDIPAGPPAYVAAFDSNLDGVIDGYEVTHFNANYLADWVIPPLAVVNPGDQANYDGDTVNLAVASGDLAGNPVTYSADGLPSGLSIASGTGVISGTIDASADLIGSFSVTVTATDSTADITASQSFAWNVGQTAAIASDGDATVSHDSSHSIDLNAFAYDAHGKSLQFNVGTPDHGTLIANDDETYTYVPPTAWTGTATFSYSASDGTSISATKTVRIDVTDQAPFGFDEQYSTSPNESLLVPGSVLLGPDYDPDGDTIFVSAVPGGAPTHGSLDYVNSDGSFKYTPASDYTGTDQFQLGLSDAMGQSSAVTVSVNVQEGPRFNITNTRGNDTVVGAQLAGFFPSTKQLNVRVVGNQAATLTISCTTGTGSAKLLVGYAMGFPVWGDSLTVNPGMDFSSVTIAGGTVSSAPRNMRLTAAIGGNAVQTWDFTVFSVATQAITTGTINNALPVSVTNTLPAPNDQLRRGMTDFTFQHPDLGWHFYDNTDLRPIAYGGIVFRGLISPSGMNAADFNGQHNRFSSFNWDRRASVRDYVNNTIRANQWNADNRSDDYDDSDEDLTPGADLGGNQLYIWSIDVPSVRPAAVQNPNDTDRIRWVFSEVVDYAGVQVSPVINWTFVASVANLGGARTFRSDNTYNNNGDNSLSVNSSNYLTIDLLASSVPNFTVTSFAPNSAVANNTPNIAFTIQGTLLNSGVSAITCAYLYREVASPEYTTSHRIPLVITNITANSLTRVFATPVAPPPGSTDPLGAYSLVVLIGGKAAVLPNAFQLTA